MLGRELPGEAAQMKFAPEIRSPEDQAAGGPGDREPECRAAAVMLLFWQEGTGVRTVLMKRNEYDGPHSGQLSFPGGMYEEQDGELINTAIRETAEETGIEENSIEVLGKLTPLFIPVSNFCVTPFVGWTDDPPVFSPDHSEVQYLLTPELDTLVDQASRHREFFHIHGRKVSTPYISIDKDILWGASAMIFSEFMAVIDQL